MKVAILGFGEQGRSALKYWNTPDNEVIVCDKNEQIEIPPNISTRLGPDYLVNLNEFDLLVRIPSLHPREVIKANLETPDILSKVTTNTNEFFRVCPTDNIISVTGTKGKGTTSTLITKMLEATGKRVHLGGNIGTPPLDLLKPPAGGDIKPEDWVVLELANFQLIDLHYSPPIAVCLMVAPEHLDWHLSFEEYIGAKQQLFRNQTPSDIAIYYGKNEYSQHITGVSKGQKIPYMTHPGADVIEDNVIIDGHVICSVDEIKLLGKHNWQNICAAITTVWQVEKYVDAIRSVVTSFSGLPNRLELVRTLNDVAYYNDSFSSGPPATIAALEAIKQPKVMIIGGYERNLDLKELAESLQANNSSIRKVLLIGATGQRVANELDAVKFDNFELINAKNMSEIVESAQKTAKPGDAVLLSPGFASFDMFKNFEDRGNQFRDCVNKL